MNGGRGSADMQLETSVATGAEHHFRLQRAASFCQAVYGGEGKWQAMGRGAAKLGLARRSKDRARFTLTYAQSHDGKIAGPSKRMLALSSPDSMIMTHTLRVLHDAILIGIGTLLNDNPQLNARLLNPLLDGASVPVTLLPRPVVLDGRLRTPLDCKLLLNAQQGKGLAPLIVTAKNADVEKSKRLCQAGAEVVEVTCDAADRLSWPHILSTLQEKYGLNSVMVEGGATIIDSIFETHSRTPLIDELIVTVTPVVVGKCGLSYSAPSWLFPTDSAQSDSRRHADKTPDYEGGHARGPSKEPVIALIPVAQACPRAFGVDNVYAWSYGH